MILDHPDGLRAAPISPAIKQELMEQVQNPQDVLTVSAKILEEIDLQANATGELALTVKRHKILGVCIPYAVKFAQLHAFGTANVGYNATLAGNISYANSWWELTKLPLFSLSFFAGPLPGHIGFNLPINYGLDLQGSVTGSVTYNGSQSAAGSFKCI